MAAQIAINSRRLHSRLAQLGAINRGADGSCCRIALTDADKEGRDLLVSWMRDAGLEIQIDPIGNIFGLRDGTVSGRPVMTGSHIDTVATGGLFDGAYGVIAGLEAICSIAEAGIKTKRPLALGIFTNEEGVRFQPDMMGSLVFAGGLALDDALAAKDANGVTLKAELCRTGYEGKSPASALLPHSFVELHIEQGPILDRTRGKLGAVKDLQGISWQQVTIKGASNHAGTTPMNMRRDAGYCAARIATFVRELSLELGGSQVGTIGSIHLSPNLINVIAREAVVTVDLRNTDDGILKLSEDRLKSFLDTLRRDENVEIEVRVLARFEPVTFDESVVNIIEQVGRDFQVPVRRMTSGAGHDAQMLARLCPSAMIFVPSIGGISHNPREQTSEDDLELGANVLLETLLKLTER